MRETSFLGLLFQTHYSEVRAFIASKFSRVHIDADDIVQDAFHNILRTDKIESIENPKAYLYQAAHNLALNRIRRQRQHQNYMAQQDIHEWQEVDEISPERSYDALQDLHGLQNALTKLPAKYRQTFLLSRVEDKTYKEISEQLGIAESTVEKHIIKVLKYLRDHLNQGAEL